MSEITNENFEQMFPIIKESMKKSSFFAIDTELTGLVYNSECIPSLFDTLEDRYEKQRQSVTNFIVCQFGLTLFSKDFNSNIYHSKTYTFYLCPRSVAKSSVSFSVDSSALEFLSYNKFDFNKFANGVSYLNEAEEENLRQNFDNYLKMDFKECPLNFDSSSVEISEWISSRHTNNSIGNQLVLKSRPTLNPLVNFAFLKELRKYFSSVWIQEIKDRFVVRMVETKERLELIKGEENEKEMVINKMIGFSAVFKCIIDAKRPIVGHNMIIDLLMIYQHFYNPLPKKLKQFKSSLHSLFPYIFDTKHILFQERQNLIEWNFIHNASLGEIYIKFQNDQQFVPDFVSNPKIEQIEDEFHKAVEKFSPHNAGFDAFATAFVFIKIGYTLINKNNKLENEENVSHNWFQLLKSIENHCNKINLIRANAHYLCITEAEPISDRPPWLWARTRTKNSNVSIPKLTSVLSAYGTSDIRTVGNNGVLIAVNSHRIAATIWEAFQNDPDIKVTKYAICKHNSKMRSFLWSVLTISTTLTAVMTYELIKCFKH